MKSLKLFESLKTMIYTANIRADGKIINQKGTGVEVTKKENGRYIISYKKLNLPQMPFVQVTSYNYSSSARLEGLPSRDECNVVCVTQMFGREFYYDTCFCITITF